MKYCAGGSFIIKSQFIFLSNKAYFKMIHCLSCWTVVV